MRVVYFTNRNKLNGLYQLPVASSDLNLEIVQDRYGRPFMHVAPGSNRRRWMATDQMVVKFAWESDCVVGN